MHALNLIANTMPKRNKSKDKVCCFCGLSDNNELKFGKFFEHGDIITHYYCLLLSSNMEQRGNDNEGILGFLVADIQKELRRGKRLICTYCKKSGATLGCCNTRCKRIFHYPCGLSAGTLNQFFGEFRSFCMNHRPKQEIDAAMKIELTRHSEITCYICYDQVNLDDITDTIWAPCCKKNAWFHRKCVQQLAMSAGYFFKCPLCNDKKSFQKAMLEFGIFIPSQDASWELVPNAFEELLYRYDQCDAPICLCPKGRKHTSFNAKWELVLCRTCGSQGIHTACGQLKWANPTWECSECTSILDKAKKSVSFNGAERILQNTSDSEDSDSDISVGNESPVPFASNTPVFDSKPYMSVTKQRPGPQTFKLKQLEAIRKIQNSQLGCSSKQQIDKKIDSVLEPRNAEECSSQFTSSEKNSTIEANVNEIKNINPSDKHSKSESPALVDNAIKLNSDENIIETTSFSVSNRTSTIPCVKETGKNDLYRSKKCKETSPLQKTSLVVVEKLLQTNDIKQSNAGNSLSNNINNTKINNSIKFDGLNDTMESNHKVLNDTIDCISNIKIINVVSLAPEEFEKVSSVNQGQKVSNIESQNEELDINLKRKIDKTTLNSTCLVTNKSKKLKVNGSTCEQTQTPSCMYLDVKNTCKNNNNNTSINNVPIYTSDNNLQMINDNEKRTSANAINLQNVQSHIPVQKLYSKSENLFPKCTLKNTSNNQTNTLLEYESKSNGYTTYAKDELNKNDKIDDGTRNCDGDAGRSPAAKSRNGSLRSDTKTNCTEGFINSSGSRSESESFITGQSKSRKNIQSTTIPTSNVNSKKSNATSSIVSSSEQFKNSGTDYTRLIPEFVRLRDLKFRVYNSNNLQMILYNKFSVNINVENTNALENNTTAETSEQTDAQQKLSEAQNETLLSFKSENILHNVSPTFNKDKTKCLHNEQSKTYHDDIKENMDPVIAVPCKSIITDNLLTTANSTTHNLTVSTNSNNLNEEKNTIPCTRIGSKIIEENNKETSQENNIINNIGNIFDALTNPTNRYSKSINNVTQSIQNLNSSCVTSTITGKNNLYNSTKHVQHALLPENHTNCISENKVKSITAIQFKL